MCTGSGISFGTWRICSASGNTVSCLLAQQADWDERKGDDPSLEELHVVADRWGMDPVHPAVDTYCVMAEKLEE